MHKELIIIAFEKAEKKRINNGEKKPSLISIAEDLSDFVDETSGFRLGERRFRDYRNEAIKLVEINDDINIKQLKVINGLCQYLDFKDYPDFVSRDENIVHEINQNKLIKSEVNVEQKNRVKPSTPKNPRWIKILIRASVSLGCLVVLFLYLNKPRFMIWKNDYPVEVELDTSKYD